MKASFAIKLLLLVVFSAAVSECRSQEDSATQAPVRKFRVGGYVKYLEQVSFVNNANDLVAGSLVHNRLNFRYEPTSHITARIEVRNRLYYGESVKSSPGFAAMLDNPNELFDLSVTWVNARALVLHSTIDRASVNCRYGKWDVTIGRQRINWGINTVWTPNDIFNSFNYFDFDYEERPGSDAVRIQYLLHGFSSLELAVRPGDNAHKQVGALLYRFNKWNYDFQFFSGLLNDDMTAGAGWAGNIRNAGFKGETSYFHPWKNAGDTTGVLELSATVDYAFKKGIYSSLSFLYKSNGKDHLPVFYNFMTPNLSVKDLMPFRFSLFAQVSKAFTPILSASLSCIFSPADYTLVALPTLTHSIADNWELSLIGQSFFARQHGTFDVMGNSVFLRIKMGF